MEVVIQNMFFKPGYIVLSKALSVCHMHSAVSHIGSRKISLTM